MSTHLLIFTPSSFCHILPIFTPKIFVVFDSSNHGSKTAISHLNISLFIYNKSCIKAFCFLACFSGDFEHFNYLMLDLFGVGSIRA